MSPLHILLVSDEDDGYADDLEAAADAADVELTAIPAGRDVGLAAWRAQADVIVFDGGDEPARAERDATAFAHEHPHTVVAFVATGVDDLQVGNYLVSHRWRAAERLVEQVTRLHAGVASFT